MSVETLGDLVRPDECEGTLCYASGAYDPRQFGATARKAGNLFSHEGVREGHRVGVADERAPAVVLSLFGAALLGASVTVAPRPATDARLVVAPTSVLDRYDLPAGGTLVGYGDRPGDPSHVHFERDVWSENPAFPPTPVAPDATALTTADATYTHAAVLSAARSVVDAAALDGGDTVVVRAPLSVPETVVSGVVAPLLAGATVSLDATDTGTVAVADRAVPESRRIRPETVALASG